MIHPATEVRYISSDKGYGLFATAHIPAGTITWVRDRLDREIPAEQLDDFGSELRQTILHFSYRNNRGNYIFCWDNGRYMNHDSNPNTSITAYDIEVAVRDICPGEEITTHYGMLNIIEPFTLPEPEGEVIHPDDLLRHGQVWDDILRRTLPLLLKVNQPLRPFITEEKWVTLRRLSSGQEAMVSIAACHFAGKQTA